MVMGGCKTQNKQGENTNTRRVRHNLARCMYIGFDAQDNDGSPKGGDSKNETAWVGTVYRWSNFPWLLTIGVLVLHTTTKKYPQQT